MCTCTNERNENSNYYKRSWLYRCSSEHRYTIKQNRILSLANSLYIFLLLQRPLLKHLPDRFLAVGSASLDLRKERINIVQILRDWLILTLIHFTHTVQSHG